MLSLDNLRPDGALRWKVEYHRLERLGSVMWKAGTSKVVAPACVTEGLVLVSKYWMYWSHARDMGLVSLIACRQQRVALPPLLQWPSWERNWVRTRGSVNRRAVNCIGSSFSWEQWLCPLLLTTSWKVAMRWPHEIRMVWDHTRTKCGIRMTCWFRFPL
jgi:hypothetical protein